MVESVKMFVNQIWSPLQVIVVLCLDSWIASFLERSNINLQLDLPEKLNTITSEDYERVTTTVLEFIETAERDIKTDLILSSRDLNSLKQPTYDDCSKLPISIKSSLVTESYDIQNDILIKEHISISLFMSFLKLKNKYFYSKTRINITLESGIIKEEKYSFMILNVDIPDFYDRRKNRYSWLANNLIEFILLAPYHKTIKDLSASERNSIQKVLENLKSIKVANGFLIIST